MKKVVLTDMVFHLWANQSQTEARTQTKTVFFEDTTIYSYGYHYALGEVYPDHNIILLNNTRYSNTTSGHRDKAWNAIDRDKFKIYQVPHVKTPEKNLSEYNKNFNKFFNLALRCRANTYQTAVERFDSIMDSAFAELHEAELFCVDFSLQFYFKFPFEEYQSKRNELIKRDSKRQTKGYKKKKAKATLDKILQYKRGSSNPFSWQHPLHNKLYNSKVLTKARSKVFIVRTRKQVKLFLDKSNTLYNSCYFNGPTLLKIQGDEIKTSKGATMPIKFATLIWKQVKQCRLNKTIWKANGHTIHAGHFRVDTIAVNGDIKVGCHFITYGPMKSIARQLNIL